ncbi:MAG: hypothetical protein IJA63_03160 [Akkermansia sp.]|nr:hypothetical protein [Akkermansia sp.]
MSTFRFYTTGHKYSTIAYDGIPSHLGIGNLKGKLSVGRNGAIAQALQN